MKAKANLNGRIIAPDASEALTALRNRQTELREQLQRLQTRRQEIISFANAQVAQLDEQLGALSVEALKAEGGVLALEGLQAEVARA